MSSFRFWAFTGLALVSANASAFGQAPARVRGIVTQVRDSSITVRERDGREFTLKTGVYTAYAYVVSSKLSAIKVGDFVGSAVKGAPGAMTAVEIAIIPKDMQTGRISLYSWDPLPDPTAKNPSNLTATSMTNGSISKMTFGAEDPHMTEGVVSGARAARISFTLTVSYDSGSKSFQIRVPSNAPVVRYVLSDRSAAVKGSSVMIKTNAGDQAGLVTVGKGVSPPM